MNKLEVFRFFAGNASRVVRAGAVAMTLYALAKSEFAVTLNRSNRHAYATE